jgi:hypothetical protein
MSTIEKGSTSVRALEKRSSANRDGSATRGSGSGSRDDATRAPSLCVPGSGASYNARPRAIVAVLAISALALLALAPSAMAAKIPGGPPLAIFGPEVGTCALKALATGSGDLSGATGKGTKAILATGSGKRTSGSPVLTSLTTSTGTFEVGEAISGTGIPAGTTIVSIGAGELTMSANATSGSGTTTTLTSGSKVLSSVSITTGTFEVGQPISGTGIVAGTSITAVGAGTLTLSTGVTSVGANITLTAGTTEVKNVITGCGTFAVGQRIAGAGIPNATTITAVGAGTLTLSKLPTAGGTGVALSATSAFGGLTNPQALAIDEAAHRFYAGSQQELHAFNSPGLSGAIPGFPLSPGAFLGVIGVDNTELGSAGRIYSASGTTIRAFEPDGTELNIGNGFPNFPITVPKDFVNPSLCGAAVDAEGNLWVGDASNYQGPDERKIHRYSSSGAPLGILTLPRYTRSSCALAFDAEENLYVGPNSNQSIGGGGTSKIWRYPAAGGYEPGLGTEVSRGTSIAIDKGRDLIYAPFRSSDLVEVRTFEGDLLGDFADGLFDPSFESIAYDEAGERVYVSDNNAKVIYAFGFVTTPDAVTGAAYSADTTHATLNGRVNPLSIEVEECRFEYTLASDFALFGWDHAVEVPCIQSPGSGNGEVDVSADLSGLPPATEFRVRLIAANENGITIGENETFFTRGPVVSDETASDVTSSSAILEAKVNPNGEGTSYRFQYVTKAEFEESGWAAAAEVPAGVVGVGSGNSDVAVSQPVSGLTAGATYRFRAVASNASATLGGPGSALTALLYDGTNCTNDALRSGTSAHLPDCRAYEQVSPVHKDGFDAESDFTTFANSTGDNVVFTSLGAFAGTEAGAYPTIYAAQRTDTWGTVGISPPKDPVLEIYSGMVYGVSGDLSKQLVATNASLTPDTPDLARAVNVYVRDTADESYEYVASIPFKLGSFGPLLGATQKVRFVGASEDGSQFYFTVPGEGSSEGLSLESTPPPPAAADMNLYEFDTASGELKLVGILPDDATPDPAGASGAIQLGPTLSASAHAVSPSGAVFWQSESGAGAVYRREAGHSTLVSADVDEWMGASPDGAVAFYETGDTVYRYDVATETSTDTGFSVADVNNRPGVLGFSDDGSYAYFVSHAALAPGAFPANGDDLNLYAWHEGDVRLVARVLQADDFLTQTGSSPEEPEGEWRVSSNGRYLGFLTGSELHGDDVSFARQPGQPDRDNYPYRRAFLYDYEADSLACASCLPEEAPTDVNAAFIPKRVIFGGLHQLPAYLEGSSRPVTDAGHFFFHTPDALVGSDVNEKNDVYQYEGGRISLISTGQDNHDSYFADASASGNDVFFFTREGLVGQDTDPNVDLYDARVNGGLAAQQAGAQGAVCQDAEQCHDAPTVAPNEAGPGTSAFEAPPQGKVKRPRDCSRFSARARELSKQARALRTKARNSSDQANARKLRRRAARAAKGARKAAAKAKRCRTNRRAQR